MHHEARPARRAFLAPAPLSAMAALVAALAGCSSSNSPSVNLKPDFVVNPTSIRYDGLNDDLLTGGIGRGGLGGSVPPIVSNPPTPAQPKAKPRSAYRGRGPDALSVNGRKPGENCIKSPSLRGVDAPRAPLFRSDSHCFAGESAQRRRHVPDGRNPK